MKDPVVLITGALTGIGRDSTHLRRWTHRCFGPARRRGPWPRPAGSTGVPPYRFVLRQRIASARRVLATPELVRDGRGVTPEICPAPAVQEVPAGREGG
jgi:hypothetical protein